MATGFVLLLASCLPLVAAAGAGPKAPTLKLRPFKTGSIKLLPGRLKEAFDRNSVYLKSLDSDMLLYAYRFFAYRKTPGRPSGGWETPLNPNRGTFLGHWLSAAAQTIAASGDPEIKKKAEEVVADLRLDQLAYGKGWVQASGPERLLVFEGRHGGDPDWSVITGPYYPIHKLLAGLLDMYTLAGDGQALTVAQDFGAFLKRETATLTDDQLQQMLAREHGGIEEVFYNLAEVTGDKSYAKLGKRFEHLAFTTPLKHHEDKLTEIHANTQLPKLVGEARRWELLGEKDAEDLVVFAWDTIANTRTYATGGSSSKEFWHKPNALVETLCPDTQESCTSYNWEKLTRHVLEWTGEAKYGDMIERVFLNGIMPAQNPQTGMFIYFLPLTTTGATKKWGSPTEDFWCCYGTMVESFSALSQNAYFQSDNALAVNLYIPSQVEWNGITVSQETAFPESDASGMTLRMSNEQAFDLMLRVPAWVKAGEAKVEVNGSPVADSPIPGTFLHLNRTWNDGDKVSVTWPKRLHTEALGNDPHVAALMFGPIVLGALTEKGVTLPAGEPESWLKRVGSSLNFEGAGVTFKPLFDIVDETYCVYFAKP